MNAQTIYQSVLLLMHKHRLAGLLDCQTAYLRGSQPVHRKPLQSKLQGFE
jgi:hypothetical protein